MHVVVSSGYTHAQSTDFADQEAMIRVLENEERMSVLNGDTLSLEKLWATSMIINNPQNQITSDRDELFALIRKGLVKYASFERNIETVRFDGDLAIVMGSEIAEPVGSANQALKIHRRFTNIWRIKDGRWQLIARHANTIS